MDDKLLSILLSGGKPHLSNLVFELESHESLMVENFARLSSVEAEMSMAEVHEGDNAGKQNHPRVVSLALLFEGIISQLVTIGLVVNFGILLKGHCEGITGEVVSVAIIM